MNNLMSGPYCIHPRAALGDRLKKVKIILSLSMCYYLIVPIILILKKN